MKKPILETGQVYKSPFDDWSSEVVGEYDAASRQTSSLSVCLSVCLSVLSGHLLRLTLGVPTV